MTQNIFANFPLVQANQAETVSDSSQLPVNTIVPGSLRYSLADNYLYFYNGTIWQSLAVGPLTSLTVDNLTVNDMTYLNGSVVDVQEGFINLNYTVTGTPTQDAGLIVVRGTSPNAEIFWSESNQQWEFGTVGNFLPIPTTAAQVPYVNMDTSLASTNVQDAITETDIPTYVIAANMTISDGHYHIHRNPVLNAGVTLTIQGSGELFLI